MTTKLLSGWKILICCCVSGIDIKSLQNRLLKVCYVPATSGSLSRLLFIFLRWLLTVLMKQTRQAVCTFKQSILLRYQWWVTKKKKVLQHWGQKTTVWIQKLYPGAGLTWKSKNPDFDSISKWFKTLYPHPPNSYCLKTLSPDRFIHRLCPDFPANPKEAFTRAFSACVNRENYTFKNTLQHNISLAYLVTLAEHVNVYLLKA